MKIQYFRGDLTDISSRQEALTNTGRTGAEVEARLHSSCSSTLEGWKDSDDGCFIELDHSCVDPSAVDACNEFDSCRPEHVTSETASEVPSRAVE